MRIEEEVFEFLYDLSKPEDLRRTQLVMHLLSRKYTIIEDVPGRVVAVSQRPKFSFGRFIYLFLLAFFPAFIYLLKWLGSKGEEKTFIIRTQGKNAK